MFTHVNWAVPGLAGAGALLAVWLWRSLHSRPPVATAFVSFGHLFVACTSIVAPLRGLLDARYPGYRFGFLHSAPGIETTLLSGSIVLCAIVSAFIVTGVKPTKMAWFPTTVSAFFLVNLGGNWLHSVLADFSQNTMQFGEYLTIPALIATPIMFGFFVAPFLVDVVWTPRRT